MARLGEQLVAAQVVAAEKVERALRAQVMWGGRLGTNLIELGCIELDAVSRALGQQHGVPAALERHFEKADPELQAQLPAAVAEEFSVIPLVRLSTGQLAVVALDPLTRPALDALAHTYAVDPRDGIVCSVAAEMRVLYHLERVYKIARPARYLRSKRASTTPFLQLDDISVEWDGDWDIALPADDDELEQQTIRVERVEPIGSADDMAALIDQAIENVTTPSDDRPAGRDRRTYVRTLGDHAPPPKAEMLGRIAIRRVAAGRAVPASLAEATRAIKRGPNRDRIGELVVETLEQFVPACEAALLLVIRGEVAIGWKHFSREQGITPEVAVPLDQPGIVPAAIERRQTSRCASDDLGPIDQLLFHELGGSDGDLVVAPIVIGDSTLCLVAAVTTRSANTAPIDAIARSAGDAFARLIRNASR